jgi:hypothetical protein
VEDVAGGVVLVVRVRPDRSARSRCSRCGRRARGYDRGDGRRRSRGWIPERCRWCGRPTRRGCRAGCMGWWSPRCRGRGPGRGSAGTSRTPAPGSHAPGSVVAELLRVTWRSVASIVGRVVAEAAGRVDQLAGLRRIGIDEIAFRKGHRHLLVTWNQTAWLRPAGVGRRGPQHPDLGAVLSRPGRRAGRAADPRLGRARTRRRPQPSGGRRPARLAVSAAGPDPLRRPARPPRTFHQPRGAPSGPSSPSRYSVVNDTMNTSPSPEAPGPRGSHGHAAMSSTRPADSLVSAAPDCRHPRRYWRVCRFLQLSHSRSCGPPTSPAPCPRTQSTSAPNTRCGSCTRTPLT